MIKYVFLVLFLECIGIGFGCSGFQLIAKFGFQFDSFLLALPLFAASMFSLYSIVWVVESVDSETKAGNI